MVLIELCLTISGLIMCYDNYMINRLRNDVIILNDKYNSINNKSIRMIDLIRNGNQLQHQENLIQAKQNKLQHQENMIIKKLIKFDNI